MVRSNPQARGYAVPTYSTTQITARETFGGPAKAGLGRHIGMGNWTYGAIVNGSSGHSAPQFAGPNYYPAFLAGRVSTLYPVSSTNQLGNISGSLANSQFGPSADGWSNKSSMWKSQQESMSLWNTVGRNMRPVRTVPNGCLNGIPARDGTCRVSIGEGTYLFHFYVYGPDGNYTNNFVYYGGKEELLLWRGLMHGVQPDLDDVNGAFASNGVSTPMVTGYEMTGDDGSTILMVVSAYHPTAGLAIVAHVVSTGADGHRTIHTGHAKKSGAIAKVEDFAGAAKSTLGSAKNTLEGVAGDGLDAVEHSSTTCAKVGKVTKEVLVTTGKAAIQVPKEGYEAGKNLVNKTGTVAKKAFDDTGDVLKAGAVAATTPVASTERLVDGGKNLAEKWYGTASEKLKGKF